jgi:predicted ATPase/class 3 adenylate cyclase
VVERPTGVVTFVLTDIVGSTVMWERASAVMEAALARHEEIVSEAVADHHGLLLRRRGEGDSTFSVFARASDGVAAAYAAQIAIEAEPWPAGARIAVRFAVHTGESVERDWDYVGQTVNRAARLRAVVDGGEVLVSASTARLVADRLPAGARLVDLGELALRDVDRPEPTYALAGPGLPAPRPRHEDAPESGAQEPTARPGFLTPVTSIVDREADVARLEGLLGRRKMVTLVGAGGTGKTRLASHFASTVLTRNGVTWWCAELATEHGADVPEVLLAALGVQAGGDVDVSELLVRCLSGRDGVLVIDNCEHVRGPVATICEELLHVASGVRILATSREPLGVPGEVLLPVQPLTTPTGSSLDAIASADAVRLFVDRAQCYCPDFCLSGENSSAVAELCRSLDGLPLALELAAARISTLTPGEMLARLDQLFNVLGHRSDHVDHHRTLRATLDWSYDLLDADEQLLLLQLAMFAPGFSIAAVEAVTEGMPIRQNVLDVLAGLVDKSMVVADATAGTTRLRLLETVRAYGLDKAGAADVADEARARHVRIYTELAEELAGPAVDREVDVRSRQLAAEAANMRLALDRAVDTEDVSSAYRMTAALVDLWCLWGWGGTVMAALEAVLAGPGEDTTQRAEALANAAWSAFTQGRHAKASAWCDQSERCSIAAGGPPVARVHFIRGLLRLLDDADGPGGTALCERGLAQLRGTDQRRRYAHDLASYGAYLAVVEDDRRSSAVADEAVTLARQLDDSRTLSLALCARGYNSIEPDPRSARTNFREVVRIGDPWCTASALWGIGWIEDRGGQDREAVRSYRAALELWSETGDWRGIDFAVQGIAIVAIRAGRLTTALALFAGADAAAPDSGARSMPAWNRWRDHHLALLRAGLGPRAFAAGWTTGESLDPDVLVKEAIVEARRLDADADNLT